LVIISDVTLPLVINILFSKGIDFKAFRSVCPPRCACRYLQKEQDILPSKPALCTPPVSIYSFEMCEGAEESPDVLE
jgi:hypothetical protein